MRVLPVVGFVLGSLLVNSIAQAQSITSDNSLGTTVGTLDNRNFLITGGRAAGTNLFHSFSNFSVPTGGSATFNTLGTPGITTIFSRVTGSNLSSIDGRIIAPANLFLLNPNGVVFGANAQLLVSGSFVGTTASSLRFADGSEFSSTNTASPLLTMSVPVGLQFGQNSGAIQVQGSGHTLSSQNAIVAPYLPTSLSFSGLRVQVGRTIALVGGDVALDGGILSAPGGRIELGSVGSGQVGIQATAQGFTLDYAAVSGFKNIQMRQRSLLDVGTLLDPLGRSAGSIQVQGNHIQMHEGSLLLSQNRGLLPGGELKVRAAGLLELKGTTPNERVMSGILSETSGLGASGNLTVSAQRFVMQNGSILQSRTFSPAPSGNVTIHAADSIQMDGLSPTTNAFNVIATATFFTSGASAPPVKTGRSGNLTVSTRQLMMRDGSYIAATSFGDAPAGDLKLNADSVELVGGATQTPVNDVTTGLISVGYRRGNSGTISLNTRTLQLTDGGTISTTHLGSGNAGSVTINASESIQLASQIGGRYSNISSTLGSLTFNRQFYNVRELVTGNAGDVTVNTPSLRLDYAGVGVGNYGIGAAGTLKINADSIRLVNGGRVSASTFSGEGGNIKLQAQTLILRNLSEIATDANSSGNGGNITISAPFIVGLGNSNIIANAEEGRGGNIQITTQGIFGLKYRDLLDPRTAPTDDITASSRFSTNGTVQITMLGVDPNSGLLELSEELVDPSQQIAQGCSTDQTSKFIVSGRGGVAIDPREAVYRDRTWSDLRDLSAFKNTSSVVSNPDAMSEWVEATRWYRDSNGEIQLVAPQSVSSQLTAICALSQ